MSALAGIEQYALPFVIVATDHTGHQWVVARYWDRTSADRALASFRRAEKWNSFRIVEDNA